MGICYECTNKSVCPITNRAKRECNLFETKEAQNKLAKKLSKESSIMRVKYTRREDEIIVTMRANKESWKNVAVALERDLKSVQNRYQYIRRNHPEMLITEVPVVVDKPTEGKVVEVKSVVAEVPVVKKERREGVVVRYYDPNPTTNKATENTESVLTKLVRRFRRMFIA